MTSLVGIKISLVEIDTSLAGIDASMEGNVTIFYDFSGLDSDIIFQRCIDPRQ